MSTASLLSWTTTEGEDSTLTSVIAASASMVMFEEPGVKTKLKPGTWAKGSRLFGVRNALPPLLLKPTVKGPDWMKYCTP